MSDWAEQMCAAKEVQDEAEADLVTSLYDEIERLRAALQKIVDGDVPRPVGKRYRADGQESKNDQCIHGEWMYDECWGCTSDLARAALHPTPIQKEEK